MSLPRRVSRQRRHSRQMQRGVAAVGERVHSLKNFSRHSSECTRVKVRYARVRRESRAKKMADLRVAPGRRPKLSRELRASSLSFLFAMFACFHVEISCSSCFFFPLFFKTPTAGNGFAKACPMRLLQFRCSRESRSSLLRVSFCSCE